MKTITTIFILSIFLFAKTKSTAQISQKYFGKLGMSAFANKTTLLKSSSNRVVVGAKRVGTGNDDAFITCIDASDNVLWTKEISTAKQDRFMSVTATSDGGCVAVGYVNQSIGSPYLDNQAAVYKFDASGTVVWNKIFKATSYGELFYSVIEDPTTNNIYCAGLMNFGIGTSNSGLIVCLNSTGTVLWSKSYLMASGNQIMDIAFHKNKIVGVGFYRGTTYYDGQLFAINPLDGSVLWNRSFEYTSSISPSNQTQWGDRIQIVNDTFYLDCYLSGGWGTTPVTPTIVRFDSSGLNALCLEYPISGTTYANVIHSKIISSKEIYLLQHTSSNGWDRLQSTSPMTDITDVVITKIRDLDNASTSKVFSKSFSVAGQQAIVSTDIVGANLIGWGSSKDDPSKLIGDQDVFKFTTDTSFSSASTSCMLDIGGQIFSYPSVTNTAVNFSSVTTPIFLTPVTPSVNSTTYTSTTTCTTISPPNIINPNFDFTRTNCYTFSFIDKTTITTKGIQYWFWDFGDGNSSSLQNPSHTYSTPGTYTVKLVVTDSLGKKDSVSKNISFTTSRFAKAYQDTILCIKTGSSTILQLNAIGGKQYKWHPSVGLDDSTIANPFATISSSMQYVVEVTDSFGCVDKDTVNITVKPSSIEVIVNPQNINSCLGKEVQLNASGAFSYKWFPAIGLDKDTGANPKLVVSGINSYFVVGMDTNGCTDSDTLYISSHPAPQLKISYNKNIVGCDNNEIVLTGDGAQFYEWSPAIYCEKSKEASTKVWPPQTTTFTLSGKNEYGCESKDTITIFFDSESVIKIPNAFTPNGDGINEKIRPLYVCNFTLIEFSIYNRWGTNVFRTTDINVGWDGNFKGNPCNMGVFYYYLKGKNSNGEEKLFKGDITLIR